MGTSGENTKATVEDYLTYLDSIDGRAEFEKGVIYDMAGGTNVHSLIGVNVSGELRGFAKSKGCRVYGPDATLAIDATSSVVMPDVHVVCGEETPSSQNQNLNTNAILIIEVLSPSSGTYDRGGKFNRYKHVPNLQEYMLIEQSEPHVEVLRKQPSGIWSFQSYDDLSEVVHLTSIGFDLPMTSIYDQVVFLAKGKS